VFRGKYQGAVVAIKTCTWG